MTADSLDLPGSREFVVTGVVKIDPPRGISSGNWFRYTLTNGFAPITGIRSGTLKSVTRYAEEFAQNLNQRALQGYSSYTARGAKKNNPLPATGEPGPRLNPNRIRKR